MHHLVTECWFVSKIMLRQVSPASAFCNSEMSIASHRNPLSSNSSLVSGKDAGKNILLFTVKVFAAQHSEGGTRITVKSLSSDVSTQRVFAKTVFRPR